MTLLGREMKADKSIAAYRRMRNQPLWQLTVNYWRDIFTENCQVLTLPDGSIPDRTEPSISHWIPSTPSAD